MDILECRDKLDVIDKQILELFEKRMDIAKNVAKYKIENNKPVLDPIREEQKLKATADMINNKEYEQGAVELFTQLMSMSRKLQYKMVAKKEDDKEEIVVDKLCIEDDTKIAFFGVEGSYAEQAMINYFGENVKGVSYDTFEKVMKSVKEGETLYGVLPLENTSTGPIAGIHTLLLNYDNYIVDETDLPIEHALLGIKGTKIENIKKVYSHQQGLMQCKEFLDEHEHIECFEYPSTSASAKKVKEDNTTSVAAISSVRAAKVYGLEVIVPKINYNTHNTTRFMIVSGKKISFKDAGRISICFEIPHKSGSLYRILSHFIFNNLNLTKIESCPIVGRSWEYRFFVDFEGNMSQPAVINALEGLRQETVNLKMLGTSRI